MFINPCEIKSLTTTERGVLCLYYGIGNRQHSCKEIAYKFQITLGRVNQILSKSRLKLQREGLSYDELRPPRAMANQ